MTIFFATKFKNENQCSKCKTTPVSKFKMCRDHLIEARDRFRSWASKRRQVGKCVLCDRPGRKPTYYHHSRKDGQRELKCGVHSEINRKRCLAWNQAHPEHSKEAYQKRLTILAAGLCPTCAEHRRLSPGERRCAPCRAKSQHGFASPQFRKALQEARA